MSPIEVRTALATVRAELDRQVVASYLAFAESLHVGACPRELRATMRRYARAYYVDHWRAAQLAAWLSTLDATVH